MSKSNTSSAGEECILCNIVAHRLPLWKVYEDDDVLAILDKFPVGRGHTLVLTKKHYPTLLDTPPEEVASLFKVVALVTKAVKAAMKADGVNVLQCNGKVAWQEIPHIHVHVIPRYSGDNLKIRWPSYEASDAEKDEVRSLTSKEVQRLVGYLA
ncbi:MAG: HIT family protein [Candidatus Bathyarchaeia archaeon]